MVRARRALTRWEPGRKSGIPWDFYSVGNQERLKVFLGKASVEKGRPGDIVEGGGKEGPETGFRRRVRRESLIGLGRAE